MPGAPPDPGPDPPKGGGRASFAAKLRAYADARLELLTLETREAVRTVALQGALGVGLVLAALFAYALLLVAVVALLGRWLASAFPNALGSIGWEVAALGAGLLHLLAAAALLRALRRKSGPPLFEYTRSEFHKDRQWFHDRQSDDKKSS